MAKSIHTHIADAVTLLEEACSCMVTRGKQFSSYSQCDSKSETVLPQDEELEGGSLVGIDLVMAEVFVRRIIAELRELRDQRIRKKLESTNTLARQCCTAVLVARDVLLSAGRNDQAASLTTVYTEFSEVTFSNDAVLIREKLERWIQFCYHNHHWPKPRSAK